MGLGGFYQEIVLALGHQGFEFGFGLVFFIEAVEVVDDQVIRPVFEPVIGKQLASRPQGVQD